MLLGVMMASAMISHMINWRWTKAVWHISMENSFMGTYRDIPKYRHKFSISFKSADLVFTVLPTKAPIRKKNSISMHIANLVRHQRSRNSPLLHPASYSNG